MYQSSLSIYLGNVVHSKLLLALILLGFAFLTCLIHPENQSKNFLHFKMQNSKCQGTTTQPLAFIEVMYIYKYS